MLFNAGNLQHNTDTLAIGLMFIYLGADLRQLRESNVEKWNLTNADNLCQKNRTYLMSRTRSTKLRSERAAQTNLVVQLKCMNQRKKGLKCKKLHAGPLLNVGHRRGLPAAAGAAQPCKPSRAELRLQIPGTERRTAL